MAIGKDKNSLTSTTASRILCLSPANQAANPKKEN